MTYKIKNLSILTNIIPPYRHILFEELSLLHEICDTYVYICSSSETNRNWALPKKHFYKIIKLNSFTFHIGHKFDPSRIIYICPTILFHLLFRRPSFFIIGDASYTSLFTILVAKILNIRFSIWIEDSRNINELGYIIKSIKSFLYTLADFCICPSERSKSLLYELGVKKSNIHVVHNAVDNNFFINHYKSNLSNRNHFRESLNLNDDCFCFLLVAQFIPRKRVLETIELIDSTSKYHNISLIVVGSGRLENQIRQRLINSNISSYSLFKDLNYTQLSKLYIACDSSILLSKYEPWGMVINESLLHNVPYIATDQVQAANELSYLSSNCMVLPYELITIEVLLEYISIHKGNPKKLIDPLSPYDMANQFINRILK